MKPRYYRSVSSKGAGRPRLMHHHKGWWKGTKWMRWVWRNGGMKFVVGENGRNPEKNLRRPHFVHHETHMEWPRCKLGIPAVGGECLTAYATRPLQGINVKNWEGPLWTSDLDSQYTRCLGKCLLKKFWMQKIQCSALLFLLFRELQNKACYHLRSHIECLNLISCWLLKVASKLVQRF